MQSALDVASSAFSQTFPAHTPHLFNTHHLSRNLGAAALVTPFGHNRRSSMQSPKIRGGRSQNRAPDFIVHMQEQGVIFNEIFVTVATSFRRFCGFLFTGVNRAGA